MVTPYILAIFTILPGVVGKVSVSRGQVGLADGIHDVIFNWAEPTEFAQPIGRSLGQDDPSARHSEDFVDPRSGTRFRVHHQVQAKHHSKVIFLDLVAGVNGTAFVSTTMELDVFVVAFNSSAFALDFWHHIKKESENSGQVFVTSTRQQGGGVFIGQIWVPSLSLEAETMVHFQYTPASYEDIFQDASITLHAALNTLKAPKTQFAPDQTPPEGGQSGLADQVGKDGNDQSPGEMETSSPAPRQLWGFFTRIFKRTWRAAKKVARVALTAVVAVAENLGLTEFSGEKTVTLYTFDASTSLQNLLPGSQCTATSTLEATVSFEMKISSANLDFATLEVSGKLANLLQITGERSYEGSEEWKVISLPQWNFKIFIGVVPVIIDVGAHLFAGYEFRVKGLRLIMLIESFL